MILLLGPWDHGTLDAVQATLTERGEPSLRLDGNDIVRHLTVDDLIEDGEVSIRWTIADEPSFSAGEVRGVLNLLEYLDVSAFEEFQEEDRGYVQAEYHAYLTFALSNFDNVLNPPRGGAISGAMPTLLAQWMAVGDMSGDVLVPRAFWGRLQDLEPGMRRSPNLVANPNLYGGTMWSTHRQELAEQDYRLFYLRPGGAPTLVHFVDDWMCTTALRTKEVTEIPASAQALLVRLQAQFGMRLGEVLLFVDGEAITFGSLRPDLSIANVATSVRTSLVDRLCARLLHEEPT